MGITIHYRGTMDDLTKVETMEDRVLDLAFSLGGRATIWRSFAEEDRDRVVRGLIVEMEPGQDSLSLLVSPDGHLTPFFQIEDAEKTPFAEPPYCFVKTQFGSIQGHIAIVHLLDAIRQQYCSNLEVNDEGGYFEDRDVNKLTQNKRSLGSAIHSMAEGLIEHGLSKEAAEDPSILVTRIERIAALVHQKMRAELSKPSDPAEQVADEAWDEPTLEDEVETMDRLRRNTTLRSERMARRIADATAAGLSDEDAFELAMQEEGLGVQPRSPNETDERPGDDYQPREPWQESLETDAFDENRDLAKVEKHPAVDQAHAFLLNARKLVEDGSNQSSFASILTRASMDIVGGLVQATADELHDNVHRALAITQLKRALSGHAYAVGAIFGLRSEDAITQEQSNQLHADLKSLLTTIHELSETAWSQTD